MKGRNNFMYQINFDKPIHVHFIGIGGISMSGLAQILIDAGFTVTGSDAKNHRSHSILPRKGQKSITRRWQATSQTIST